MIGFLRQFVGVFDLGFLVVFQAIQELEVVDGDLGVSGPPVIGALLLAPQVEEFNAGPEGMIIVVPLVDQGKCFQVLDRLNREIELALDFEGLFQRASRPVGRPAGKP